MAQAEKTWSIAWEILHDRDGWNRDLGNSIRTGTVYSKTYQEIGRVSKLEVFFYVFISCVLLFLTK